MLFVDGLYPFILKIILNSVYFKFNSEIPSFSR